MLPTTKQPSRRQAQPAPTPARPPASVPNDPSPAPNAAVSSSGIDGAAAGTWPRPTPATSGALEGHALVAVGPGIAAPWLGAGGYMLNPLPIQPAKIHCPLERSDTLTRPRLNGWLDRAASGRLALIVAEAGFGKTTLLGDWARHTTRFTIWYRLESDDRDWLTFVRHLVASGRELDPAFAPSTFAMLLALGTGGPTQKDVVASIVAELADFAATLERGLTLIIDDYHVVDGFAETETIVKALLERTGPHFSLVLASRSAPTLPLSRLRSRGGVMTLSGRDLCFDEAETSQLFREAYQLPLADELIGDLCQRTEGWAALLTLVHARLEEHSDPRDVITQLAASQGDMYDFVAEEVLAALPAGLAHFLMNVAVFSRVDVELARLVTPGDDGAVARWVDEGERLGLLVRPERDAPHRFHPLVREFLLTRLRAQIGEDALRELHRGIARRLPASDWQGRASHFLQAGDAGATAEVVDGAIEQILAAGDLEHAKEFLAPAAGDPNRTAALLIRSKLELLRGDYERALRSARLAVERASQGPMHGLCLLNLASVLGICGIVDEAAEINEMALELALTPSQKFLANGMAALLRGSQEGDLQEIAALLADEAKLQESAGLRRYAGVSRLNLAATLLWIGDAVEAATQARLAESLLGGQRVESVERTSATSTRAVAIAQLGRLEEAEELLQVAAPGARTPLAMAELNLETARLHLEFGDLETAVAALQRVDPALYSRGYRGLFNLLSAEAALRQDRLDEARLYVDRLGTDRCADAAGKLRSLLLVARIALRVQPSDAPRAAREAWDLALRQQSPRGAYAASLLHAVASAEPLDPVIARGAGSMEYVWSTLAEEIARALPASQPATVSAVEEEAARRPKRWRDALRKAVLELDGHSPASAILAGIGDAQDAAWLRQHAVAKKVLRPAALEITQRLAEPVILHDLGVVRVTKGSDQSGRPLRRKVLALLCYLSTRPRMAASREEPIEALWPDLGPEAASNSLHQAIYYMRRVFEPDFREGLSAGYIRIDEDVVSLNARLVQSDSLRCWQLLKEVRHGDMGAMDELLALYVSRYALTFAYDDWAESYRENLHAAVLAAGEAEMAASRRRRDYERCIRIGHGLLTVDSHADAIELELLRAYKAGGWMAAAAEQYAHYSSYVRGELGAEPPPFGEI